MKDKQAIANIPVGTAVNMPLAVISATPRKTKTGKPYLQLDLFDSFEVISGNYWDWLGKSVPQKNTILNVAAQVTEWQGKKQLNISSLSTNTDLSITDFAPSSNLDIDKVYLDAYNLMSEVQDSFLRTLSLCVLEALKSKWMTVPGAKTVHHAYVAGTLIHSYSVARLAKAIATESKIANVDLCVVGGMMHDIGKLFAYVADGVAIEMTEGGLLYDHLFIGAEFIGNYAEAHLRLTANNEEKLRILRHIILSHHGSLEHGAVVTPALVEAHIVHYADAIDATIEQIRDASTEAKWTDRLWALGNRPHISYTFIEKLMTPQTLNEEEEIAQ